MKKILLVLLLGIFYHPGLEAQTVTITSPGGLEPPYEVPSGTSVTFTWDHSDAPTAFFTYAEFPDLGASTVSPDPNWTQRTNFTNNGNGTYSLTLTVSQPVYVWAGNKSGGGSGFEYWNYSNVTALGIASGVTITAADGYLCGTSGDTEALQTGGSYNSYQWYFNNEPIGGATASGYQATQPGQYKVQVPLNDKLVFSNTKTIRQAEIAFTGELAADKLTMTASAGLTSYQWLSGPNAGALTPVSSATTATYTATLTSTTTYYAVRAVQAGCTVETTSRPASTALFTAPSVTVNAPVNEFNKTCTGTTVTLSVPDQYTNYAWHKDGDLFSEGANAIEVSQGSGIYHVNVAPLSWPEIIVSSQLADVEFFSPIKPVLTGPGNNSYHFAGEAITITLVDDGYDYAWYQHTVFNYTEADRITVDGVEYSFTFQEGTRITVVASYLGCESATTLWLRGSNDADLFLELSDESIQYLCPGTTVNVFLAPEVAGNYENFQWFRLEGEQYKIIAGATTSSYKVAAGGTFVLRAQPKGCAGTTVESYPREIQDNEDRSLFIESETPTLCVGEKATLTISDEWTSIQWFEKKIVMGANSGYEVTYVPLSGAGTASSLQVSKFTTYVVKAKHKSCTSGLKITSAPFELKPTVNPDIAPSPEQEVRRWHKALYDSIANYLYCAEAPLTLTLPEGYSSYKWYKLQYNGDDDYELGNEIADANGRELPINATGAWWYTAMVEVDGCTGYSDPVLIDTWVHVSPGVASRNNNELCGEGDSTLLNSAFESNWVKYEWYKDGELIPNSDNDSIYVKEPGGYTVTGYPEECPHIGYSSGLPVWIHYFPKASIAENDTVLYALPEEGYYEFQWYRDGEPIESEEIPWILHKSNLEPGSYTVRVTNPIPCSSVSDPFLWTVTGTENDIARGVKAYPNPTRNTFTLQGLDERQVEAIHIYNAQGIESKGEIPGQSMQFDLSSRPPGIYIIKALLKDGGIIKTKVVRQ
jgi:hypothetical protein